MLCGCVDRDDVVASFGGCAGILQRGATCGLNVAKDSNNVDIPLFDLCPIACNQRGQFCTDPTAGAPPATTTAKLAVTTTFTTAAATTTAKDCSGLGWGNTVDNVCSSVNSGGTCGMSTPATFAAAAATCKAAGARLCTMYEVMLAHDNLDSSGATGCASWRKWKPVWVVDGCKAWGQQLTANTNGNGLCADAAVAGKAFTQCCKSEPRPRFCAKADARSAKMYTAAANGVCARADWGSESRKQCWRLGYENTKAFCARRGGKLCTTAQLRAIDPIEGQTGEVDVSKLPPGACGSASKPDNTQTWIANSDDDTDDLHCASKNDARDFYRPISKWRGYLRYKKKTGQYASMHRCAYKGNVANTKGTKFALCCFEE